MNATDRLQDSVNLLQTRFSDMQKMVSALLAQQTIPSPHIASIDHIKSQNDVLLGILIQNWTDKFKEIEIDKALLEEQVAHVVESVERENLRRHSAQ